jgi:hypothetical protein
MKAKYFFSAVAAIILFLTFNSRSFSQDEMDFEEFMGMMSSTFTDEQLDEISYMLPWDIKVYGYAYGDFSGEGYNDLIISVREKGVTPPNSVDVYILKSIGDKTYALIDKQNYKYYELTLEVAFLVRDGVCLITNRDNNNWYFTSYQINQNHKFVQLDKETYPIEFQKAGN